MSSSQSGGGSGNGSSNNTQRPTAKRSPSILVTDVRSHNIKGTRAPFAGQNFRKQQQQLQQQQQQSSSGYNFQQSAHQSALQKRLAFRNKYTDISVDKLLSNSSDIPSGQSRIPSTSSSYDSPPLQPTNGLEITRRNIRSIPKLSQSLPSRTSKTSQKLVLIPEQQQQQQQQYQRQGSMSPPLQPTTTEPSSPPFQTPTSPDLQPQITRSRAELLDKEARAQEFSRMTAYFICESFNLKAVAKFLGENHEVKPRIYDEALYVPYSLPLLPGNDGLRVKSNNSAKLMANNQIMEKLINRSEQTDHLYEYYSGVETPEDANNYSMDPEVEDTNAPFDPSEPQFFAPPLEERPITEDRIIQESPTVPSTAGTTSSSSSAPRPTPHKAENKKLGNIPELPRVSSPLHSQSIVSKHHAEMFIFEYGIVVFWNFSEIHEKNILADLAFSEEQLVINPINEQDIETEEFHFEYDAQIHRPRIFNDMVTLRSGDHMIKLTMSHAIAQSTKLGLFESRMVNILSSISRIPKKLALTGRIGYKRNQLLKKSGKLFKLRVDVNLSSSILDTPDFFWDMEPALHPLYQAVREYLEIDQRVTVLNDRCKVFLEFVDIVSDSMSEKNTNRITWMIIVIIGLSLFVSLFEFILEILPKQK
ncbi:Sporulation protein RMD8 [Spathaspora sp. JA1]|nr:Sporulation protein RMD8 [Spathaspora sp. JA1]